MLFIGRPQNGFDTPAQFLAWVLPSARGSLFQYPKESEDRFRVLNPAIVDHLEGLGEWNDVHFDHFILVWPNLRFSQVACLVQIHEFGCKSRRCPEATTLSHRGGEVSRL